MANPKYADLPGIAHDQPDVYETNDLPESEQGNLSMADAIVGLDLSEAAETACGCKGIRSCLICEQARGVAVTTQTDCDPVFTFQPETSMCKSIDGQTFKLDGIQLLQNFISENEELNLILNIDSLPWVLSQSGRLKQDFGPKVNFKRKKCSVGSFKGFPDFCADIIGRIVQSIPEFVPAELCHLDYCMSRGSHIDPHIDDIWLWGDRLVTLNLGAESILTLTATQLAVDHGCQGDSVAIPLLRRSLLVLQGCSRYHWNHSIARNHVTGRRVAMTFRELTPEIVKSELGNQLLDIATHYLSVDELTRA